MLHPVQLIRIRVVRSYYTWADPRHTSKHTPCRTDQGRSTDVPKK